MANAEKDTFDVPVDDEEFFDVLDDEEEGGRGPILIVVAILVLVAFSGVIYVAYNQGVREGMRNAPEMLRADSGPFRAQPEDRGGVTVEHTEKEVLKSIAPGQSADAGSTAGTEELLPPPETPMTLPSEDQGTAAAAPAIGTNTDIVDQADSGQTEALLPPPAVENTDVAPPETVATAETSEAVTETPATEPAVEAEVTTPNEATEPVETVAASEPENTTEVTEEPAYEPVTAEVEEEPVAPAQAFNDPYVVQLASFRTNEDAMRAWESFKGRFGEVVGQYGPDVKAAEVPNRGTYHRLRVGPMEGRPAAEAVCGQLKSRGQDCLVTAQ